MSHGLAIYITFSIIYFLLIGGAIYKADQVVKTNRDILIELKKQSKN